MKRLILIICCLLFTVPSLSVADKNTTTSQSPSQWAVAGFVGRITSVSLKSVLIFNWTMGDAYLLTAEVNYMPDPDNIFRRLFSYFNLIFEVSGNITYQIERNPLAMEKNKDLVEFNPYIDIRWTHFPWNHILKTRFTVGEGISYATRSSFQEVRDPRKAADARQLLNYLIFEIGFSLPKKPQWELFFRIHHRSGAFGLYCPGVVGSTAVGLGLRYRFF